MLLAAWMITERGTVTVSGKVKVAGDKVVAFWLRRRFTVPSTMPPWTKRPCGA